MEIYVAKLNWDTTEQGLRKAFEEYGEVDYVKIATDKYSGKSEGFGYVEMPDDDEARSAIEDLNGSDLDERIIIVKKAEKHHYNRLDGGSHNRGGGRGRR